MTKKKKRQNPEIEDLLARPWCYYCERDFDDLKILIHHQKAKHFKCERCARRLNTAGGLRVHMEQVHKETLEQVENALPGRESIDLEIFGTEGIPESEVLAHNQRIMAEYAQKEADRRAASGQSNGPKKPKIDISKELDPEEIRRKLEAHKKAMASGGITPVTPGGNMSPGRSQSPAGHDPHAAPQVPPQPPPQPPPQVSYSHSASPPSFQQGQYVIPPTNAYPPANSYPPTTFPPQAPSAYPATPYSQPPYQPMAPAPFGRGAPQAPYAGYQQPPAGYGNPPYSAPPQNQYQQPGPPPVPPRHQTSSLPLPHQIPGLPPKPNIAGLPPRPAFTNHPGGFGGGGVQGTPSNQWIAPSHQQQQQQQQQHNYGPAASLPPSAAAGFGPPSYGAPPTSAQPPQFPASYGQQASQQQQQQQQQPPQMYGSQATTAPLSATPRASTAGPGGGADAAAAAATAAPGATAEKKEAAPPAKPKREMRLIYDDNDMSPEEKRAMFAKYAVKPADQVAVEAQS